MPQDIDGAIARGCKASGAALRNRLIMRPANAAKRRRVALRPSRGAKAPDGPPDDDQFQVRKVAAFSCRLWPGCPSRHIRRASSGKCEATLKGTVGEIVALIIRVAPRCSASCKAALSRAMRQAGMISKGAAFISFRRWIGALLPCRGENGSIPRCPLTAARFCRQDALAAADLLRAPTRHQLAPQTSDCPCHRSERTDRIGSQERRLYQR